MVIAAFLLAGMLLILCVRLSSPYALACLFLFALAPLRFDDFNPESSFLIFLGWWIVLLCAVMHAAHNGISIRKSRLEQVRKLRPKTVVAVALGLAVFISLWLTQMGVTEFSGHHARERLPFANIVNTMSVGLTAYAVLVLGLWDSKISWHHKAFGILVLCSVILGGFLINKRGMFAFPLVGMMMLQFLSTKAQSKKLKSMIIAGFVGIAGAFGVIEMTAQRGGTDWQAAIQSLQQTLSGERGNGLSPNMEHDVLEYTQDYGTFLPAYSMFSGFYGMVPRAFWPDKPDVSIGPTVGALVYGTGGGIIGEGAGTPVSPAAQFAGIFGPQAYVLGLIFVAGIFIIANRMAKKYPLLIYFMLTYAPWIMGSDIGRTQIGFTVGFVVLVGVLKIFGLQAKLEPPEAQSALRRRSLSPIF